MGSAEAGPSATWVFRQLKKTQGRREEISTLEALLELAAGVSHFYANRLTKHLKGMLATEPRYSGLRVQNRH